MRMVVFRIYHEKKRGKIEKGETAAKHFHGGKVDMARGRDVYIHLYDDIQCTSYTSIWFLDLDL